MYKQLIGIAACCINYNKDSKKLAGLKYKLGTSYRIHIGQLNKTFYAIFQMLFSFIIQCLVMGKGHRE